MTELVNYLEAIYITSKAMEPVELGYGCFREFAWRYLTLKSNFVSRLLPPSIFRAEYNVSPTGSASTLRLIPRKKLTVFSQWHTVIFGIKTISQNPQNK